MLHRDPVVICIFPLARIQPHNVMLLRHNVLADWDRHRFQVNILPADRVEFCD